MIKDFLISAVKAHLMKCGYSESASHLAAYESWGFYCKSVSNSKDPFKECCDYAAKVAKVKQPDVKYQSPKAKARPRKNQKPQSAFDY